MLYFLALIPATALTLAGYVVLVLSARTEGALRSFGRYLGFWAFTPRSARDPGRDLRRRARRASRLRPARHALPVARGAALAPGRGAARGRLRQRPPEPAPAPPR